MSMNKPYRLKLTNIKGELKDDWIELLEPTNLSAFSNKEVKMSTEAKGFLHKGSPEWAPLIVKKNYDFSSPTLLKFLIRTDETAAIDDGTIEEKYVESNPMVVEIKKARVAGISIYFRGGEIVEEVVLDYQNLIIKNKNQTCDLADKKNVA